MRRYAKVGQLKELGVAVPTVDGEPDSSLTEEVLDGMLAAEKNRRTELYKSFVQAGTIITFRAIGVQILEGGDEVYTIGYHSHWEQTNSSRLLGPLAGAEARVTDGTSAFSVGKAMLMPLATAPLARKETADAMIVFADSTVHSFPLDGSSGVRQARKEGMEFNARAGTAAPAASANGGDPAASSASSKNSWMPDY